MSRQEYPFENVGALPGFIKRVYPAAGVFKVAAQKNAEKDKVKQWVQETAGSVQSFERCDVEMEDVFVEKVS
jgi:hypothetical protein